MTQAADEAQPEPQPDSPPPRKRWPRYLLIVAVALVVVFLGAELFARFALGLGDPPVSVADPEIEYLFKPNSTFHRFGNTIHFNQWSMRSPDFSPTPAADELRVMVVGDSIINGGGQTDDSELATTLVAEDLRKQHQGPVTVANVSAGSWGPPNQLAYVRRFGLFGAGDVVIVLNGDDAWDVPAKISPVGRSPEFPDHSPPLALVEIWDRVVKPKLGLSPGGPGPAKSPADEAASMGALATLIDLAREKGANVAVIYWPTQAEVAGGPAEPGRGIIEQATTADGATFVDAAPFLAGDADVYRDPLHPNPKGQKDLAKAIEAALNRIAPATQHAAGGN